MLARLWLASQHWQNEPMDGGRSSWTKTAVGTPSTEKSLQGEPPVPLLQEADYTVSPLPPSTSASCWRGISVNSGYGFAFSACKTSGRATKGWLRFDPHLSWDPEAIPTRFSLLFRHLVIRDPLIQVAIDVRKETTASGACLAHRGRRVQVEWQELLEGQ